MVYPVEIQRTKLQMDYSEPVVVAVSREKREGREGEREMGEKEKERGER